MKSTENDDFALRMMNRRRSAEFQSSQAEARRVTESISIKKPPMLRSLDTDSPVDSPGSYGCSPPASPSLASPSPSSKSFAEFNLCSTSTGYGVFHGREVCESTQDNDDVLEVSPSSILSSMACITSWFQWCWCLLELYLCVQCLERKIRGGVVFSILTVGRCHEAAPLSLSTCPRPIHPQCTTGK